MAESQSARNEICKNWPTSASDAPDDWEDACLMPCRRSYCCICVCVCIDISHPAHVRVRYESAHKAPCWEESDGSSDNQWCPTWKAPRSSTATGSGRTVGCAAGGAEVKKIVRRPRIACSSAVYRELCRDHGQKSSPRAPMRRSSVKSAARRVRRFGDCSSAAVDVGDDDDTTPPHPAHAC